MALGAVTTARALTAQTIPADSAKRASAEADSAAARGTLAEMRRSVALRHLARSLYRQVGDRKAEGDELHRIGNAFVFLRERDSAGYYFQVAIPIRRAAGDRQGEGRSLNNVGLVYSEAEQHDSALTYLHRALAIARALQDRTEALRPLANIGAEFRSIGQNDSALVYYREAIAISREIRDRRGEGRIENNVGNVHLDFGHRDSALVHYRRALEIARGIGDRPTEAAALENIGVQFETLGEPDSALSYDRASLAVRLLLPNAQSRGPVLTNLAIVFQELGQSDSAVTYFREGLKLAQQAQERRSESSALNNLGSAFLARGLADSAMTYLQLSLPITQAIGDRRGEGKLLSNISSTFAHRSYSHRQADSALAYARRALAINQDAHYPAGEGYALHAIGEAFNLLGRPDSAIAYYSLELRTVRSTSDRRGEGITLHSLGALHESLRQRDRAVAYFDSAASVKATVARRAGTDFNRLTIGEVETPVFDEWVRSWLARSDEVGRERAVLAALAASERGRAQALLDLMRDTTGGTPPGRDLAAEGASLLARVVGPDVAALSYLMVGDTLLVWIARSGNRIWLSRVPVGRDHLREQVGTLRAALGLEAADSRLGAREAGLERGSGSEPARGVISLPRAATALSRILLPPAVLSRLTGVREILVVTHGVLGLVPFSMLPVGTSSQPLGDTYAVRYAPSLSTLGVAQSRRPPAERRRNRWSALVVGNPAMPEVPSVDGGRVRLSPLIGAERESLPIGKLFGAEVLTGGAATEFAVRGRMPDATVIHLATHGLAYSTAAMARKSFVALAPGDGHDGLLSVGEILDDPKLRLSAELVVLSACQTGLGDLSQAEGTVGFQRALLAKGARSVLVSLWSVSDDATRILMEAFYRHWVRDRDAPSKAEALRRAQRDVRRIRGFEHPRFWAGFQLVGAS